MNNHLPTARTCEGCYRLRNDTCSAYLLPVVNFEPVGFKCPLDFNRPFPKVEAYKVRSVLLFYSYCRRFSVIQIAKEFNISSTSVIYWFKKNKLKTRTYSKIYGNFT